MNEASKTFSLLPEDAHPKAQEALTDAFFWDTSNPLSPFGDETGLEVLEALQDFRLEEPDGKVLDLLSELLARWEVTDEGWETVEEDEVQALGADDETGLLLRDEVIIALAFAQLIVDGRVDPEVRRRAILAITRQSLPALVHGFGFRGRERTASLARMREILGRRWD